MRVRGLLQGIGDKIGSTLGLYQWRSIMAIKRKKAKKVARRPARKAKKRAAPKRRVAARKKTVAKKKVAKRRRGARASAIMAQLSK